MEYRPKRNIHRKCKVHLFSYLIFFFFGFLPRISHEKKKEANTKTEKKNILFWSLYIRYIRYTPDWFWKFKYKTHVISNILFTTKKKSFINSKEYSWRFYLTYFFFLFSKISVLKIWNISHMDINYFFGKGGRVSLKFSKKLK